MRNHQSPNKCRCVSVSQNSLYPPVSTKNMVFRIKRMASSCSKTPFLGLHFMLMSCGCSVLDLCVLRELTYIDGDLIPAPIYLCFSSVSPKGLGVHWLKSNCGVKHALSHTHSEIALVNSLNRRGMYQSGRSHTSLLTSHTSKLEHYRTQRSNSYLSSSCARVMSDSTGSIAQV